MGSDRVPCHLSREEHEDDAKSAAPQHVIFTCNEPITSWHLPQCPVLGPLRQTDRYIIQGLCQLSGNHLSSSVSGLEACAGRYSSFQVSHVNSIQASLSSADKRMYTIIKLCVFFQYLYNESIVVRTNKIS